MTSPNPHRDLDATISCLVEALHDMRDALVKTSLMLQDAQLDFDSVQRRAATEHARELIDKVKPR